jgi:hypothetical protein
VRLKSLRTQPTVTQRCGSMQISRANILMPPKPFEEVEVVSTIVTSLYNLYSWLSPAISVRVSFSVNMTGAYHPKIITSLENIMHAKMPVLREHLRTQKSS